jgi:hypothetical protein
MPQYDFPNNNPYVQRIIDGEVFVPGEVIRFGPKVYLCSCKVMYNNFCGYKKHVMSKAHIRAMSLGID